MAATQRLELRQSQSLVMTPQLQQAIKLLQLSNTELVAYVESELERNPLLERDDGFEPSPEAGDSRGSQALEETFAPLSPTAVTEPDSVDRLNSENDAATPQDAPLDTEYENLYNHDSTNDMPQVAPGLGVSTRTLPGRTAQGGDERDYDQTLRQATTLRQFLLDQVQISIADPVERIIGAHLVDMLDESGYLVGDLEALSDMLGVPRQRVEDALQTLRGFEPTGVFARSLGECLAIQLSERDRLDPAMRALLDNLDLLAKAEYGALQRICGVDREDLSDMLTEIRALNPKPGLDFAQEPAHPLVPDVLMRRPSSLQVMMSTPLTYLPPISVSNSRTAWFPDITSLV